MIRLLIVKMSSFIVLNDETVGILGEMPRRVPEIDRKLS